MEDFLQKKKIQKCSCAANKSTIYTNTYNEHYGNSINQENIDVLILLEFKETFDKLNPFLKLCENYFKNIKYAIIPALGCTPIGFSSQDTINTYVKCKEYNIKKIIEKYNPKCIITTGRALYSITESKGLRAEHFFIPVNNSLQEYQKDDCWLYSQEFNCKIFPIPALYQWISDTIKDVYEYKFITQQFKFILSSIVENKRRISKYNLFLEKNPNSFLKELIKNKVSSIVENKRRISKYNLFLEKNPNSFLKELIKNKDIIAIAIDIETSNLNYIEGKLYSIQFSFDGRSGYFCYFDQIDKNLLIELFNRTDIDFCLHHSQFDLKFLISNGIYNAKCTFDTMLASHLLNENTPNGLKQLTWIYTQLGGYDIKLKQYIKQNKNTDFTKLPEQLLLEYACYDSIITYQLYIYFKNRLELEDLFIKDNFYKFIMPAIPMIIDIEMTGVQIDIKYLNEYVKQLKIQALETEQELYKIAGYTFNLKSGKELSKVLRNLENFKVLTNSDGKELLNKNGDLTLDKETLERYAEESNLPFMKKIAEYNHITKEISQFGYSLQQKESTRDALFGNEDELEENEKGFLASIYNNRLYGGYKLHGTETGRMSGGGGLGSSINWQNMPKTKEFRKIFLPSKNMVMAFADYDAMEVCIFSQISGPGILESLILENKDMHCYTCVQLFELLNKKTTYEEVFSKTKIDGQEDKEFVEWRGKSKSLNFQGFYGATGYGIANLFGVSTEEGNKFLDAFYKSYPEVATYITNNREHAKKYGWVKSLLGRKRRLPQLTYIGKDSFYNKKQSSFDVGNLLNAAINAPVQGTSGQTTIIAMINIWKEFKEKNLKSKILINVHDEIVFELDLNEIEEVCKIIKYWMEIPYYKNIDNNQVKLMADIKYGEIWKYGYGKQYWDLHQEEWNECLQRLNVRNTNNFKIIV